MLALPGVLDVVDDLAVAPGERSDARLRREVAAHDARRRVARRRPRAGHGAGRRRARRGLREQRRRARTGRAATREPRRRATSTSGPLRIVATSDGTWREDARGAARTDDDLARAFLDAMARDPRVQPFLPGVQVRDRVLVVTGEAPDVGRREGGRRGRAQLTGRGRRPRRRRSGPRHGREATGPCSSRRAARSSTTRGCPRGTSRSRSFTDACRLRGSVASEADRRRAIAAVATVPGARGVDDDAPRRPAECSAVEPRIS